MPKTVFLFVLLCGASLVAAGQSNDLAGVVGVKITPSASSTSGTTTVNKALGFEGSFAHQIKGMSLAALQVELPVMVTPKSTVNSSNFFASKSYSSIYVTPGIRLRFAPSASVSPWVAVGVGIARFNPSATSQVGGTNPATGALKGAGDAGGGLDFKAPGLPLTFRVEVREYFSGAPNLNIPSLSLHNNIFAGGGVVLRF
ncbi:MAG TPA: hypothetical protein VKY85_19295 [Candidatus Angelobacter sp.]|nr:hypothetical protein [Candidatus Angelobacter sp.]